MRFEAVPEITLAAVKVCCHMLRVIKCNCLILLLRSLAGLRMMDVTPTGLMDLFGLQVNGLKHLLHSIKLESKIGLDALQYILRHRKLPFREIYVSGCDRLMDLERIREIIWAHRFHLGNVVPNSPRLLPSECLTRLPKLTDPILKHIRSSDVLMEFPPDQVSPIYSDEALLVEEIVSAAGLNQRESFQQTEFPALLQNCNWFYYGRASSDFHKRSASMSFASRTAWKAFHHSCYHCDRQERGHIVGRVAQSIRSLVSEDPVLLLHFSLLSRGQIAEVIRWCVHLAHIMIDNLQIKDDRGNFVSDPIRDYFVVLQKRLLWVRKSSMHREPIWILKKLLKALVNMYRNTRVVIPSVVVLSNKVLPVKLPAFQDVKALILEDAPPAGERNRFHLDLVLLYSRLDERFLLDEPQEEQAFLMTTPIEQWHTVREYLESYRHHLHPFRPVMILAIRSNWRLQRRLLDQFASSVSQRSLRSFKFIIESVPFEARAKFARYRFMKSDKQMRRLRIICETPQKHTSIPSRINSYFAHLIAKKYLIRAGSEYRLVLMKTQKLALLSFMVNASFIYGRKLPVRIESKQLMLLLGYHETSEYSFEGGPEYDMSVYFDHAEGLANVQDEKSYDRVSDAITMSQSLVPIIFTWREFNSAIQP